MRLHRAANARLAPAFHFKTSGHSVASLLLLAFLAEDELAGIFDALALIRLRRTQATDFRRDLPDLALVDTGNCDLDRPGRRDRHARRNRKRDVVAVAERQLQVLALHRRLIADAGDFQPLLVTGRD